MFAFIHVYMNFIYIKFCVRMHQETTFLIMETDLNQYRCLVVKHLSRNHLLYLLHHNLGQILINLIIASDRRWYRRHGQYMTHFVIMELQVSQFLFFQQVPQVSSPGATGRGRSATILCRVQPLGVKIYLV